ncbi:MAG TPA: hypothetical protein PK089_08115 [Methanoregulaceae archaeon]|nr:hypothetical protein [Methanoregulaceae archaeon]HOV67953.1 hypothetical protein [Methanoregulaceae archaeon]HQJ87746.1 hypothetical protein [Methanoregulaceae archaeon]
MSSTALDAEEVAVLCIFAADGDLSTSLSDLADLLEATQRRARSSFGPSSGSMRQALLGLALEAALVTPDHFRAGELEAALGRVTLRALLLPMLSRDRLWFTGEGAHWTAAAPGALASPGSRHRAERLLALISSGPSPPALIVGLERLGWSRAFVRSLLSTDRRNDADDLRHQVAWQDWFE